MCGRCFQFLSTRCFRWVNPERFLTGWRHPYFRLVIAINITFLNFLIFAEDPIAHSRSNAELPIVGNAIAFLLRLWPRPDARPVLLVAKLILAPSFVLFGMWFGRQIFHHKLLRDLWKLRMFQENKGTWFIMFFTTILSVFIGSELYNFVVVLDSGTGKDSEFLQTAYIGLTNENFMKIAATGTWFGDSITAFMVADLMLQDRGHFENWFPWGRDHWKGRNRLYVFWGSMIVLSSTVVSTIFGDFINWDEYNWSLSTNEFWRALLAAFITWCDLMIVMQDWEFPYFETPQDVKIVGFDLEEIRYRPRWLQNDFFEIHVTGSWFNYSIIFMVMILDFNLLKNQIIYTPASFGQYTDPLDRVWTVGNQYEAQFLASNSELHQNLTWAVRGVPGGPPYRSKFDTDFMTESRWLGGTTQTLAFGCGLLSIFGIITFFYMHHAIGIIMDRSERSREVYSGLTNEAQQPGPDTADDGHRQREEPPAERQRVDARELEA